MTKTKNINQTVTIQAKPAQVYDALMRSAKHARFTGEKAKISRKVGGRFSAYDGFIDGFNLELVANKLIVQAWRGSDWPKGYYSVVTYALSSKGAGGTLLKFTQIGVPADDFKSKSAGWKDHYWKPLKLMLEKSASD